MFVRFFNEDAGNMAGKLMIFCVSRIAMVMVSLLGSLTSCVRAQLKAMRRELVKEMNGLLKPASRE